MADSERVLIFGDTRGIKPQHLKAAVEALAPTLEGSYLKHDDTLPDEELVRETEQLFTDAGISDPPHPVICGSAEEKVKRVISCLQERQTGKQLYIIDRDPNSFVETIRRNSCPQKDTLASATLLVVSSARPLNYQDMATGIRIISFPDTLYRFPTHPTPAS